MSNVNEIVEITESKADAVAFLRGYIQGRGDAGEVVEGQVRNHPCPLCKNPECADNAWEVIVWPEGC